MTNPLKIVAVTACVTGVAHTYMAAEQMKKEFKKHGYNLKVETQGVLGSDYTITDSDVEQADIIILTKDIDIVDKERFDGYYRVIKVGIKDIMMDIEKVIHAINKLSHLSKGHTLEIL
ncbi:fructose PTS transporter subunit IIB [Vibrio sp.]|nr:fructose PTS transporter subunit IIB [Vibrio sp.]